MPRDAGGPAVPGGVLFVAATEREILPLRRKIGESPPSRAASLAVTGAGKVPAAIETFIAIRELSPALCIQVGCAGAFPSSGLAPGDVAVAAVEILGDEGVEAPEGFLDLASLGLSRNEVPVLNPRFEAWEDLLARVGSRFVVRCGRLVTVSTGSGTAARAAEIARRWDPLAESMEGAAGALAALRAGCPFLEVRGISNAVGDRRRGAWEIDRACENAAEVALHLAGMELTAP